MAHLLKYVVSGGIGLAVNLGSFVLLLHLEVHYLVASVIAFALATVVGFVLQKYWTFGERSHAQAPKQFALYALSTAINLGINTLIVYVAVDLTHAPALLGQLAGAALVALSSYFVYRHIIFVSREAPGS